MKKKLGILTVGILGVGSFASVISCAASETPKTPDKDKAVVDKIISKITVSSIGVLPNTSNTDASKNASELNKLLLSANKTLTNNDLKYISYSGTLIQDGETNSAVQVLIKSNNYSKTIEVEVILSKTNEDLVNNIALKIVNTSSTILIPNKTDPQKAKDYKNVIDEALLNNNRYSLNANDLLYVSYTGTLAVTEPSTIKAQIKIGSDVKIIDLTITWAQSDQQKANAIKDLMKVGQILLNYTAETDAAKLQTQINAALKAKNPLFTDADLNAITYAGIIAAGKDNPIVATITIGGATTTFENYIISVKDSDTNIATQILNEVQNTETYVLNSDLTAIDVTNTAGKTVLDALLSENNVGFNSEYLSYITFKGKTATENNLQLGAVKNITVQIKVNEAIKTKDIKVLWAKSDEQKLKSITNLINNSTFYLSPNTNINIYDANILANIKKSIIKEFPVIKESQLDGMKFDPNQAIKRGDTAPLTGILSLGTNEVIFNIHIIQEDTLTNLAAKMNNKIVWISKAKFGKTPFNWNYSVVRLNVLAKTNTNIKPVTPLQSDFLATIAAKMNVSLYTVNHLYFSYFTFYNTNVKIGFNLMDHNGNKSTVKSYITINFY